MEQIMEEQSFEQNSEMSWMKPLRDMEEELSRVIVGQTELKRSLILALMTGQHVLLEGVPGLAKTLAVKTLAQALGLSFKRIQFTPDLLPSDLLGTQVFHPATGEFSTKKGPLFAQVILADEINRAPAKVQSALLEAMEERQITIGDQTYPLPEPFLVLATQNPMEQEGTYPLPEAQLDRFMFKVLLGYPERDQELELLRSRKDTAQLSKARIVPGAEHFAHLRAQVEAVHLAPEIEEYVVDLVRSTRRESSLIRWGASPRAVLFLSLAARAFAAYQGRDFVLPQDVSTLAFPILRHRILLTYEAAAEQKQADDLIAALLLEVESP